MESQTGIASILLCKKNTLLSTRLAQFAAGLRDKAEMNLRDHTPIKTIRNQSLTVLKNFNFKSKSFQATLGNFWKFTQFTKDGGCDAQISFTPQTVGQIASGGIMNFTNDEYMGLMWSFMLSNKERSIEFTLEQAVEQYIFNALISQSLLNNRIDLTSQSYGGNAGCIPSDVIPPAWISCKEAGIDIFSKDELVDYQFMISTKETEKTAYNRSKVDYMNLQVVVTGTDATITKILATEGRVKTNSLIITQYFNSQYNDVIKFNQGVLARTSDPVLSDDKRHLKVTYEAEIPKNNVEVLSDGHTIEVFAE